MNTTKLILRHICCLFLLVGCQNGDHKKHSTKDYGKTRLILSGHSSNSIAGMLDSNDLLKQSYSKIKDQADKALDTGIEIPEPLDPGGGYSHEKHKKNYADMYAAGIVYSITKDSAYADYVEQMLLGYADLYPSLPLHPKRKANHPSGKLFWQGLNESVWLFYSIQAYDLVKESLTEAHVKTIEEQLFGNLVTFLSEDSYETFNKIHNHGTWSVAAVGMTGYVLKDTLLVNKALHGSELNGQSGFYAQLNTLFSPDGYYSEGPYYQRYAMLPFVVFAEVIQENQPELEIFQYRDQLLHKAITTIFQLTTDSGEFYPYNDAIKDKDFRSRELVFASNIGFTRYNDSTLLSVIKEQNMVTITNAGLKSAIALNKEGVNDFKRLPKLIRDGADGASGGLALLRMDTSKKGQFNAVLKFATHGMGHGHFDRLSLMVYDEGREVLQDYGAARYLNVESKRGGRYLPENTSFAKQSIAHNTLIVDETSHYNGNRDDAEKFAPQLLYADLESESVQIISVKETTAYDDVVLKRTIAMIDLDSTSSKNPMLLDVFRVDSERSHQYDLNYQYLGQLMDTNYPLKIPKSLNTLGHSSGYQHLYKTASGSLADGFGRLTFLNQNKFYSISTVVNGRTDFILTEMGATDPDFNLRHDPGYLIRRNGVDATSFVSIIEPHGSIDPRLETVQSPNSNLEILDIDYEDENYMVIVFQFKNQLKHKIILSFKESDPTEAHELILKGETFKWKGNYKLITIN
ncbi:heparinase II/III family protein [Flavivirga sp. 57AJ16]|uniref:heparinase II/III domain-containing protein n=1 Tax=Flavivirga sp. 57AJ16 TaxID=3025307 RepID=UPI002365E2CB|nr:heparinase II/III family protein [Flavivirga sp. 57AJ16]MDD7887522.1 heparinase II/III family protein [Flavivirga sp. 57AJ16]